MSQLKVERPKVRCMDCKWLVIEDLWCESFKRDLAQIRDIYEEKPCRRFKPLREGETS